MALLNFIMVVLPPVVYSGIIYLTSPNKSISLTKSLQYLIGGILSIPLVMLFNLLLPYKSDLLTSPFVFCFFEVAPHEEISKLLVYFIIYKIMDKQKSKHPIGTMFYMGMVGLGFAMIENVQYLCRFGEKILFIRNFTSTFAHMIFGMFTGYWISLSKIKINKYSTRSVFDIVMSSKQKIRFFVYVMIGLMCGIGYHGLWNYNLTVSGKSAPSIMILMLFIGLISSKFASNNLRNKKNINKENEYN